MRTTASDIRKKKYFNTALAVAEGLWNGIVVSGVLFASAFLIDRFWPL